MPDNNVITGIAEQGVKNLKEDDIVQFERFGFARLDEIKADKTLRFWFTHK
jgi:glutamyl-tRNA synthetase